MRNELFPEEQLTPVYWNPVVVRSVVLLVNHDAIWVPWSTTRMWHLLDIQRLMQELENAQISIVPLSVYLNFSIRQSSVIIICKYQWSGVHVRNQPNLNWSCKGCPCVASANAVIASSWLLWRNGCPTATDRALSHHLQTGQILALWQLDWIYTA